MQIAKTLRTNYGGKIYLEQCQKITVKSVFKKVERQLKKEILSVELDGIELIHTRANYGGYRTWFKCPCCSIQVFTLYDVSGEFKCRKCSGLPYKKQRYRGMLFVFN